MRTILAVSAVATAVGIGFAAGRVRPAQAVVDEHAGHDMSAISNGAIAVQQTQGLPASGAGAADRLAKSGRHAEWVVVKVGDKDSVAAWIVYPERKDKAPVVVAIHENAGGNPWTRSVADQLAADGFIAIAPDLTTMFRTGDVRSDPTSEEGRAGIPKVTPEFANKAIEAVANYAMSQPSAIKKYGIVGFCWGGARSFNHATAAPGLGASVVYYGSPPTNEQMAAIKAPVLGLYGGNDARINATIPATDSTMKALGKAYEHHIFDGAGHGFLRAQNDAASNPNATDAQKAQAAANLAAAQQAWPKTIAFFKSKLGG